MNFKMNSGPRKGRCWGFNGIHDRSAISTPHQGCRCPPPLIPSRLEDAIDKTQERHWMGSSQAAKQRPVLFRKVHSSHTFRAGISKGAVLMG